MLQPTRTPSETSLEACENLSTLCKVRLGSPGELNGKHLEFAMLLMGTCCELLESAVMGSSCAPFVKLFKL